MSNNPYLKLSEDGKTLIRCDKSAVGNIIIPYGVTKIGDEAFKECANLTSVEIPDSVTVIGDEAFSCCTGLTSVKIPSSVVLIGNRAFFICKNITTIEFASGVVIIGDFAFDNCTSLTSIKIPSSVKEIGDFAFNSCTSLTTVEIPNSVRKIGKGAFGGYTCISHFVVDKGNPTYCSENGSLYLKDMSILIRVPGLINSFTIPSSVTTIGSWAFSGCTNLTSVVIPSSVTHIGYDAFYNCRSLTSVEIPNSVTKIGSSAFSGCTSLTSIEIPRSVTEIEWGAFNKFIGIKKFVVDKDNPNYCSLNGVLYSKDMSILLQAPCNIESLLIPSSVTEISWWAFSDCTSLTSIEIPDSVTKIGYHAFSDCTSLTELHLRHKRPLDFSKAFEKIGENDEPDLSKITLYVPIGSGYDYRHHPFYSKFAKVVVEE